MIGRDRFCHATWRRALRWLSGHPTIYYTKQLIRFVVQKQKQRVVMTCDFHGHSRKNNVFMYGCVASLKDSYQTNGNPIIHAVPEAVHQVCPIFNYKDCKFAMEKDKETTARIVLFKEFGILNSYTLETTFFGSDFFRKSKKTLAQE